MGCFSLVCEKAVAGNSRAPIGSRRKLVFEKKYKNENVTGNYIVRTNTWGRRASAGEGNK